MSRNPSQLPRALLAAAEVTHFAGQRNAAAREVRALVGESHLLVV
ncbi:hypothetical protein P3T27_008081, partial [Kitasatospora sp. MAA19]|nr:hypothetical protein [Kitasatospora sp. MAA19]